MFKNVASQKVIVFAFDATTNVPKTGDAAQLAAYVAKDFGSVTQLGDTSATEMDATNAPGYYLFDITQTETNADVILVSGKSSTSNIKVIGAPAAVYTRPTTGFLAPATAGRTLVVDANGLADANMVKAGPTGSGSAQTARDIGASVLLSSGTGTGQLDFTSGVVKSSLVQILGTALTETSGQIAAAFKKFFDKATPTGTINSIPDAVAGAASGLALVGSNMGTTTSLTGDAYARLGAPGGASVSADVAAVKVDTAAVKVQTDKLAFTVTNQVDANVLDWKSATAPAMTGDAFARVGAAGASLSAIPWNASWDAEVQSEVQDALDGTLADSIPADGTRPSISQALYMLTQFMLERAVSSTTVTVKKVDGSSTLFTLTLDSATAPTSITRAT